MFMTAMAVIVGGAVILFDPIFQGLAISLMAGEIASLLISPYEELVRRLERRALRDNRLDDANETVISA